jgi:O-antigen ligase
MKKSVNSGDIAQHRIYQILLFSGPLITLAVNPWTSYDPIGLPKMLLLASFATSLGFLLISRKNEVRAKLPRATWIIFATFATWLVVSMFFSGAPLQQQFWGSFGRNTGFLTYVSLLTILIATAILSSRDYYAGLTKALVGTALPMTAYCLVQMAGKDPIGWSEFATFGTLGNVNFLSAFFGMTSLACLALASYSSFKFSSRSLLAALGLLDIYIAFSTGSIQGVVIFIAGIFALLAIRLRYFKGKIKISLIGLYIITLITSVTTGTLGLVNKGPLAQFLFQPSVIFRSDYIHAGWEMTLRKPLFGVGLDSYGDWYRESRGEISTLRAGVDRIANSAHNIFLDISSNGGVVLGISFLAIVLIAGVSAIRFIKSESQFDPYFAAIASVWFAYQIQALVSINQIGVGVWGWILSGALIGYGQLSRKASKQQDSAAREPASKKSYRGAQLSAKDSVAAISGFALGLLIAAPPVSADIGYRTANLTGDIARITTAVNKLGGTQFHKELALDFAMRNNREAEVGSLAKALVLEYPRSFFGWRVLSVLTASTPEERELALIKARELDPFNPELG